MHPIWENNHPWCGWQCVIWELSTIHQVLLGPSHFGCQNPRQAWQAFRNSPEPTFASHAKQLYWHRSHLKPQPSCVAPIMTSPMVASDAQLGHSPTHVPPLTLALTQVSTEPSWMARSLSVRDKSYVRKMRLPSKNCQPQPAGCSPLQALYSLANIHKGRI